MECPICSSRMQKGFLEIDSTFFGSLLTGSSEKHVYFEAEDGSKTKIMDFDDQPSAWRCIACQTVIFSKYAIPEDLSAVSDDDPVTAENPEYELVETKILSCQTCGAENPDGIGQCIVCGKALHLF